MLEDLPPEEAAKVAEMFSDLSEFKKTLYSDNTNIKEFISTPDSRKKLITYGQLSFYVLPGIPVNLRAKADQIGKSIDDENDKRPILVKQAPLYEFVAGLCLDAPFNDVRTWAAIDEDTGEVSNIFTLIIETITEIDDKIKKFRGK